METACTWKADEAKGNMVRVRPKGEGKAMCPMSSSKGNGKVGKGRDKVVQGSAGNIKVVKGTSQKVQGPKAHCPML